MNVLRMFGMILDQKCNITGGTVCLRVIVWDSVTSEHTLFLTGNTKSKSGLLVSFGKKTAISWADNCIDIIKVLPGHWYNASGITVNKSSSISHFRQTFGAV